MDEIKTAGRTLPTRGICIAFSGGTRPARGPISIISHASHAGAICIETFALVGVFLLGLFWVGAGGAVPADSHAAVSAPVVMASAGDERKGGVADQVMTDHVTARLVAERGRLAPGESMDVALVFEIRPGWHTYWRNPGDSGEAPRVVWTLPSGVTIGPMRWPRPELIPVGPLANYGYSHRVVHLFLLTLPASWPAGEPLTVGAEAAWLVCEEECIPESGRFELRLSTGVTSTPNPEDSGSLGAQRAESGMAVQPDSSLFAEARAALPDGRLDGAILIHGDSHLTLAIPARALGPDPDDLWFFAGEWGLIEHAAAQTWRRVGDHLLIDLLPGSQAPSGSAEGLLVVTDAQGGIHSYELEATPGVLPGQVSSAQPASQPGGSSGRSQGSAPAGSSDTAPGAASPAWRDPLLAEGVAASPIGFVPALLFALFGGVLLNLMPCVFPILAMKALSFVNAHAKNDPAARNERVLHGLAYTGGVLAFFALLSGLLLALRAGGAAVGWGFQLQYPPFVALMAYVFLTIGLSLAGAVTLGAGLMRFGGIQTGQGVLGAFGTGALAALVAAPCTAPLMGAALGYAVTLNWPLALTIMLTLGFGLALPFLVLSMVPGLARLLPRPGPWMETLKQALAFPMFAAAGWLVWVLSVQAGPNGVALVLSGLIFLVFGLWLRERTQVTGNLRRRLGRIVWVLALAVAIMLGMATRSVTVDSAPLETRAGEAMGQGPLPFESYSAVRLAKARAEGRPVFVNMTAAWCITCLVNERVALTSDDIARTFAEAGVLYLKGDWTSRDASITEYLAAYGRNGVPLYVFYPANAAPQVLPQVLTEDLVRRTILSVDRLLPDRLSANDLSPDALSSNRLAPDPLPADEAPAIGR